MSLTPRFKAKSQTSKDYIAGLKGRMKEAQELMKTVSDQARLKIKKGSDKNARSAKINVGDKVLVKIP